MINETIKKLYNELIYNLLVEEKVEKIVCHSKYDVRFFDNLYVDKESGTVIVHNNALNHDFKGFNFDTTVDFAECLSQIEKGIFLAKRGVINCNCTFGLDFTFSKEEQDRLNDDANFISLAR